MSNLEIMFLVIIILLISILLFNNYDNGKRREEYKEIMHILGSIRNYQSLNNDYVQNNLQSIYYSVNNIEDKEGEEKIPFIVPGYSLYPGDVPYISFYIKIDKDGNQETIKLENNKNLYDHYKKKVEENK